MSYLILIAVLLQAPVEETPPKYLPDYRSKTDKTRIYHRRPRQGPSPRSTYVWVNGRVIQKPQFLVTKRDKSVTQRQREKRDELLTQEMHQYFNDRRRGRRR